MNVQDLMVSLFEFLGKEVDQTLFYDENNLPFVSLTFLCLDGGKWMELTYSAFLKIKLTDPSKSKIKPTSTLGLYGCVSHAKVITASHIESSDFDLDVVKDIKSNFGFCSSIRLDQDDRVVIAVIASPMDTQYLYKYIKNQIEILCEIY